MGVHDKDKYPEVKKLLGIPEDEPVFILRAQDRLYTMMIAVYEQLFVSACAVSVKGERDMWEFVGAIDECREEGRRWQKKNEERVKIPD